MTRGGVIRAHGQLTLALAVTLAACLASCGEDPDTGSPRPVAGKAASKAPEAASDAPATATAVPDSAELALLGVDSLSALGDAAYSDSDFDVARTLWEIVLRRTRDDNDPAGEARALTSLGLAAWRLGDFERADRLEREAVAVEREHELRDLMPRSLNALGLINWDRGRFGEAAAWLDSTAAAARVVDDVEYRAKANVNLALVETAIGLTESARRRLHESLETFRAIGLPDMESRTLTNLVALELAAGDPRAVLAPARRARDLARQAGDLVGEEAALGQLAGIYAALGRHREALAVLDTAIQLARRHGQRQAEAANLETMAGIYRQLGDLRRALRLYDEAGQIDAEVDLRVELATNLYHVAEIHAELGNLRAARDHAARALGLHRQVESPFGELADLLLLAELAELAGNPEEADAFVVQADGLAGALGLRSTRVGVTMAAARLADRRGDDDRVIELLDSIEEELPIAGYAAESEGAHLRARAFARRGNLEEAVAGGRRAIELVERARGELPPGMLRSIFAHSRAATYADLVDVLLKLERWDEAYVVAATAGSREPRLMRAAPASGEDTDGTDESARERLLRRIGTLAEQIRAEERLSGDPDYVGELVHRLREERRRYEELLARTPTVAGTGSVEGPSARATAGVPAAAHVKAMSEPGEALLQYLVGEERTFAFLVTREGVRGERLGVAPDVLATRVRLARRLLDSPTAGDPNGVLERLYRELITPLVSAHNGSGRLEGLEGVDRLVIVPHGVLTYLPFAALRDPEAGRWLAEKTTIVHLTSASALVGFDPPSAGERDQERSEGPVEERSTATVFAPFPERLPATRAEAVAVSEALGEGTRSLIGDAATESAVRRALGRAGIVHIATHAELNATSPLFSSIELADGLGGTPPNGADGRLEVHELLDLTIRSRLVFLSGCETGVGTGWRSAYTAGEDFATLERGFLRSGATGVVATLWRVEDESAARFAARFYKNLSRRYEPAEALAAAQRELMRDPRFAHPFHWAAYRLAGVLGATRANAPTPSV